MKLTKLIFSAAAFLAGGMIFAQSIGVHGYMDYTNYGIGQRIYNADGTWEYTDPAAEFGSFYNGRTELRLDANASNVEFHTGVRLGAGLSSWYNLYHDLGNTTDMNTFLFTGNVKVNFLNGQLALHTGRYEEANFGYIFNGYQLGASWVTPVAQRGYDTHFTGLEVAPYAVPGLKMLVGLPILPGIDNWNYLNDWAMMIKGVKFMGSYNWLRPNIGFNFGYRPFTFKTDTAGSTAAYTEETLYKYNYGEAYVQANMPTLFSFMKTIVSYDFRYRTAKMSGEDAADGKDWSRFTMSHSLSVSGQISTFSGWTFNVEDRFAYLAPHYLAVNETALFNILGIGVSKPIVGTDYVFGVNSNFEYGQDANGSSLNSDGEYASQYTGDGIGGFHNDWMAVGSLPGSGAPGRYITVFASPYFQKNFQNGYFQVALDLQYNHFTTSKTTQSFNYRVPFKFCFWF